MVDLNVGKKCKNCDSTSMEMCLLIRHCPYWAERVEDIETNIVRAGGKSGTDGDIK